ncbi:MAG TPA: SPOR domain-containing protein [Asticcacaulis sp.]|nr:SPOR domain-containing protein [Asticcacaulis sp.]
MTDLVRLRKVGIVCAAASLVFGLSACDSRNLSESFAAIKAIRVDDSANPNADQDHKKVDARDLKLVVDTAKALTVDTGGLLAQKSGGETAPRRLAIDVVDPLKMPPPDDGGPLRVLPADIAAAARLQQAAHDLPDLPIQIASASDAPAALVQAQTVQAQTVQKQTVQKQTVQKQAVQAATRLIQIGSFSSIGAARQAWDSLQERYPIALRYKARFQPITTADGRAMVRLKVGPVEDAQAEAVCQALSVRDSWCAKAS